MKITLGIKDKSDLIIIQGIFKSVWFPQQNLTVKKNKMVLVKLILHHNIIYPFQVKSASHEDSIECEVKGGTLISEIDCSLVMYFI